jgi:hypothetical protein
LVEYKVSTAGKYASRYKVSYGAALVGSGWARTGLAVGLGQPVSQLDAPVDAEIQGDPARGIRASRGVWLTCAGRMHLPGGQPAPATSPATWSIDANGITHAIGPLTLSPTLTPESALTIAGVAAVAPVELVLDDGACVANVPSLQLMVLSQADDAGRVPCGATDVSAIYSSGPGIARTDRGLKTGDAAAMIKNFYPRVAPLPYDQDDADFLPLAGSAVLPLWAWTSTAALDEDLKVDGFVTKATLPTFVN